MGGVNTCAEKTSGETESEDSTDEDPGTICFVQKGVTVTQVYTTVDTFDKNGVLYLLVHIVDFETGVLLRRSGYSKYW